jgi:DNA polymerase (family 10)
MDNHAIAVLLDETADLLEISAADPFRVRSYRRAAEAIEATTLQISKIAGDAKQLLTIAGIGKSMVVNIQEIEKAGTFPLREELMVKYRPSMLELLRLPGMGPKSVALMWEALGVGSIEELSAAIADGRVGALPRFGEKAVEKLRAGIEEHKKNTGRFKMSTVEEAASQLVEYLREYPGFTRMEPAGSFRRGRETVGDLDMLVTGPGCAEDVVAKAVEYVAAYPLIGTLLAKGANKVSFRMRPRGQVQALQVDVRLLPEGSWGAAQQYFTGSKMHNVSLRQRALRQGYTLSEYALARVEDGSFVAGATEEEIYNALGLDWIAPEMRENNGEIVLAEEHRLPKLITQADIRGDVHAHTVETDGANTIREMAEAALARGYGYLAITDHSKALSMINGLTDERALAHIARIRQVEAEMEGRIRIFTGIEADILGDGAIDLSDEVLAQMDVVIASLHSQFTLAPELQTERMLRALENPYVRILGHPTGRMLLRREAAVFDMEAVLKRAAELGVGVEHNASPSRLDLCDVHLRMAKEYGCRIVVNTDAHGVDEFGKMRFGVKQLRRAWLTAEDVINTREAGEFLASMRPRG